MKKVLSIAVLALAASAAAQTNAAQQPAQPGMQQPGAQQGAGQPAAQQQPGAQPGQQPGQQQKKEIKDAAEYNAFISAIGQQDPNQKAQQLEAFLQQYPNTIVKEEALEQLMAAYQQANNAQRVGDAANRLLQVNPNNVRALALMTFQSRTAAESGLNPAQNAMQARQFGERGLQALQTMQQPEGMQPADFQKFKEQLSTIFYGGIGFGALQAKDFRGAQTALRNAVNLTPNDLRSVYPLAIAYFSADPPDELNGLWYIARAVNLAQGSPAQAQIADFGRKRFRAYAGKDEGWQQLLQQTAQNPNPPAGFTIAKQTPQEKATQLMMETPLAQMPFSDRAFILQNGTPDQQQQVWASLKGNRIALDGMVIEAEPAKLMLAVAGENREKRQADVELTLADPAKELPQIGSVTEFEGNPTEYVTQPGFRLLLDQGTFGGQGAAARAAAQKKAEAAKKPAPKKPAPRRRPR